MTDAYDVPYMERTRDYYRAQGYTTDYQWAHFEDTPFQPLLKSVAESRLAVITTAMPDTEEGRRNRQVYATPVTPVPESMYTDELSWDKATTHTRDVNSFLPLRQLEKLVAEGVLGNIASHFYSAPTEYSKRATTEQDAPEILRLCREDRADIALLVPL